jgi:hypothetical protein
VRPGRGYARTGLLLAAFAVVLGRSPSDVSAQRIFLYSEPTVCTPFFQPISGLTFHAGGAFDIDWFIPSPAYGPVTYTGQPNPAVSEDGTKKWANPTANVTCFIDWFQLFPTPRMDTYFRWHINFYGGTVSNLDCGTGSTGGSNGGGTELIQSSFDADYDPYDSGSVLPDCGSDPGSGGGGTGTQYEPGDYTGGETVEWGTGIGNGGKSECGEAALVEYVCVDIWIDGEWVKWSCGFATTC